MSITCVVVSSISCFGQTAFLTVKSTPYDHQMARVSPVLNSANMQRPDSISLLAVSHLMMQLRDMPYQHTSHWQTPMEVDLAQAADCKGKALALYAQMREYGARNVRVVIGRHHIYDSRTHAWLEWQAKEGSYVLDPTFNDMPTKTAELSLATYVPLYAYDGAHKYRAKDAGSAAPSARVATGPYVPARTVSSLAKPAFAAVGSKPSVSSTPVPPTKVATGPYVSARTVSTLAKPTFAAGGSRPSVSSTLVRMPTTQHLQPNTQRIVSNAQRSPNVEGVRQSTVIAATTSKAKSVASTHRKGALTQKGHARHRRHTVSSAARLQHVRSPVISQNEKFVIPVDSTLPPQQ